MQTVKIWHSQLVKQTSTMLSGQMLAGFVKVADAMLAQGVY